MNKGRCNTSKRLLKPLSGLLKDGPIWSSSSGQSPLRVLVTSLWLFLPRKSHQGHLVGLCDSDSYAPPRMRLNARNSHKMNFHV